MYHTCIKVQKPKIVCQCKCFLEVTGERFPGCHFWKLREPIPNMSNKKQTGIRCPNPEWLPLISFCHFQYEKEFDLLAVLSEASCYK